MSRFTQTLLRVMAAIVLTAAGDHAFAQAESIHGVVVDEKGKPLRGAQVELRSPTSPDPIEEHLTDTDGGFGIAAANMRPGNEIRVVLAGYDDGVLPITGQHLVVASIRVTMTRAAKVDTKTPAQQSTTKTAQVRYVDMTEQQKRAVRLYNEGAKELEEAKKSKQEKVDPEPERKLREAASLDPSFAAPHRVLLNLAMEKKNWGEASRYADDLIRIDPKDAEAVRTLYISLVILRHDDRVGEAAKRLVAINPGAIVHVEAHAQEFFKNNNFTMARALYQALKEMAPSSANAYLNLGVCCASLGDVECTKAAYQTFIELAPEDHPDLEAVRNDLAALR